MQLRPMRKRLPSSPKLSSPSAATNYQWWSYGKGSEEAFKQEREMIYMEGYTPKLQYLTGHNNFPITAAGMKDLITLYQVCVTHHYARFNKSAELSWSWYYVAGGASDRASCMSGSCWWSSSGYAAKECGLAEVEAGCLLWKASGVRGPSCLKPQRCMKEDECAAVSVKPGFLYEFKPFL